MIIGIIGSKSKGMSLSMLSLDSALKVENPHDEDGRKCWCGRYDCRYHPAFGIVRDRSHGHPRSEKQKRQYRACMSALRAAPRRKRE
jgi:hypothetical protein